MNQYNSEDITAPKILLRLMRRFVYCIGCSNQSPKTISGIVAYLMVKMRNVFCFFTRNFGFDRPGTGETLFLQKKQPRLVLNKAFFVDKGPII